jgi:YVTN family beta-propeller protein
MSRAHAVQRLQSALGLGAALVAVLGCGSGVARAQANIPPVARASVGPLPARPGDMVPLVGSASSDPDGGPAPLTFSWDFGDGAMSTLADPTHAYAERGIYTAALTVFDGAATAVATVRVRVLEAPLASPPVSSSPLALTRDGTLLWTANEDADSVSLVDVPGLALVEEVPACGRPRALALSADESRLFVACHDDGTVAVLDVASRSVVSVTPVGRAPVGLAVVPGGAELLVTLHDEGAVRVVDAAAPATQRTVVTGGRPHALAVTADGTKAIVGDFLATATGGRAFVIDLTTEVVEATVALAPDTSLDSPSSGRGVPNLLSAAAIEPSGRLATLGGLKSNVFRGLARDGEPLLPTNRVRGLVSPVEIATALDRIEWRFDLNDADSGSALAYSPDGQHLYVAHQGLGEVSVYDVLEASAVDAADGSAIPFVTRVPVGWAPNGLALGAGRLLVLDSLGRSVTVLDLTDPVRPAFVAEVPVATETLAPEILNGKRMFHASARPRHSSQGYVACASCHPDGGHDGMTWDFTDGGEGLRNTIDLRGRGGVAHGPVHWSANFDEIQDFENDIVRGFGGTGLADDGFPPNAPLGVPNGGRGQDLDDLAAYVSTFTSVARSLYRDAAGALAAEAQRGKGLFYSAELACASCHVPPRFTDSTITGDPTTFRLHDVGTLLPTSGRRLGGALVGLDTPTVLGLWDGAPYLHDGRAPDLRTVVVDLNPGDRHGRTSQLSAAQVDDLVAFLLSIDGLPDVLPGPHASPPDEVAPPAAAGRLRARKAGQYLHLSWPPADRAETYVVARGDLGDFTSHRADVGWGSCDTGGEVQLFDPDDLRDGLDAFYLVAARNAVGEGPYAPPLPPRRPTSSCP